MNTVFCCYHDTEKKKKEKKRKKEKEKKKEKTTNLSAVDVQDPEDKAAGLPQLEELTFH